MPDVCRLCEASTSKTTCFGTGPGPGALSGRGPQKSQNGKIFMRFSQSRHINRISVLGHFKAFGCQGPVLGPNPTILQRPSRVARPPNGPASHVVGLEIGVVRAPFIKSHLFLDRSRAMQWGQKFVLCVRHSSKSTCLGMTRSDVH